MSSVLTAASPVDAHRLPRATWALRGQFFVSGALFATWGVHVPTVKAHYGLGDQPLALAMLASGVGALVALLQAGRVVARHGPRAVSLLTGVLSAAAIGALIVSDAYPVLIAVMLLYGVSASLFDVAINAEASEIERQSGRPLMSGFHALFSSGGMVGAAVGSALPWLDASAQQHLLSAAVVCSAMVLVAGSAMLPLRPASPGAQRPPLSLPRGRLALLGVLAAVGLITEGAMYDWSVLFIHEERQGSTSLSALGYACFTGTMAAARFGGDAVRARLPAVTLLRLSGVLAAVGMALALMVPLAWVALLGFVLVGLGLANVVPVLFSAASTTPGVTPAHGIAAVSSLGYLDMMAGPPLIGLISERTSLTTGLCCVVAFALVLALSAKRAIQPGHATAGEGSGVITPRA